MAQKAFRSLYHMSLVQDPAGAGMDFVQFDVQSLGDHSYHPELGSGYSAFLETPSQNVESDAIDRHLDNALMQAIDDLFAVAAPIINAYRPVELGGAPSAFASSSLWCSNDIFQTTDALTG